MLSIRNTSLPSFLTGKTFVFFECGDLPPVVGLFDSNLSDDGTKDPST